MSLKTHKKLPSGPDLLIYSMCAHTGAPKRFFFIFAKRTIRILIYVDVITFQINLLYFLI